MPFRCLPARRNFSERSVRPSCFQMCLPALGFFPSSSAQATFDQPPPVVKAQYDPPLPQTSALPCESEGTLLLIEKAPPRRPVDGVDSQVPHDVCLQHRLFRLLVRVINRQVERMPSATQFVGSSALLDNLSLLLRHRKPSFRGVLESFWCLPQCLVRQLPELRRLFLLEFNNFPRRGPCRVVRSQALQCHEASADTFAVLAVHRLLHELRLWNGGEGKRERGDGVEFKRKC